MVSVHTLANQAKSIESDKMAKVDWTWHFLLA
jgi:hypothetical protein